jgi:hypothetical protein
LFLLFTIRLTTPALFFTSHFPWSPSKFYIEDLPST